MIRGAIILVGISLGLPAIAENPGEQISEAGTAFIRHCLADVTDARIALLRKQAPDLAASMSDDELMDGAERKARKACPCFLHIIGISPQSEGATPEEKVATVVAYLDAIHEGAEAVFPPVLASVTKMCGERSSVLPPRWLER